MTFTKKEHSFLSSEKMVETIEIVLSEEDVSTMGAVNFSSWFPFFSAHTAEVDIFTLELTSRDVLTAARVENRWFVTDLRTAPVALDYCPDGSWFDFSRTRSKACTFYQGPATVIEYLHRYFVDGQLKCQVLQHAHTRNAVVAYPSDDAVTIYVNWPFLITLRVFYVICLLLSAGALLQYGIFWIGMYRKWAAVKPLVHLWFGDSRYTVSLIYAAIMILGVMGFVLFWFICLGVINPLLFRQTTTASAFFPSSVLAWITILIVMKYDMFLIAHGTHSRDLDKTLVQYINQVVPIQQRAYMTSYIEDFGQRGKLPRQPPPTRRRESNRRVSATGHIVQGHAPPAQNNDNSTEGRPRTEGG